MMGDEKVHLKAASLVVSMAVMTADWMVASSVVNSASKRGNVMADSRAVLMAR